MPQAFSFGMSAGASFLGVSSFAASSLPASLQSLLTQDGSLQRDPQGLQRSLQNLLRSLQNPQSLLRNQENLLSQERPIVIIKIKMDTKDA